MNVFLLFAMTYAFCLSAHASELDSEYTGPVVSATKQIAVKLYDGTIQTFDVSGMDQARINNDYLKTGELTDSRQSQHCSRLIGELASDFSFKLKTDENEIVTLKFKASTPESQVRVAGDCDDKITGNLTFYNATNAPFDLTAIPSDEPAGAPGKAARYYGNVVHASTQISVREADGRVRLYDVRALKVGGLFNDLKSLNLSETGAMSMCGDSLGELAQDFFVTLQTRKGMRRTAIVRAAPVTAPKNDQVRVFGECHGKGLSQLQLSTSNSTLFEIQ